MMPNIDPRQLKSMMAKMGIQSSEIEARTVVIECSDKKIIISEPQVTKIEAQGTVSFQISGHVSEMEIEQKIDVTEDDIKAVMDASGSDRDDAAAALEKSNGDIAAAIMDLKQKQ